MKRKRSFRRLLRSVAAGEEITIASRGVPVACLVPVHTQKSMRKTRSLDCQTPRCRARYWIHLRACDTGKETRANLTANLQTWQSKGWPLRQAWEFPDVAVLLFVAFSADSVSSTNLPTFSSSSAKAPVQPLTRYIRPVFTLSACTLAPGKDAPWPSTHTSSYRKQIHQLRPLADSKKSMEADFFKCALQKIDARSMREAERIEEQLATLAQKRVTAEEITNSIRQLIKAARTTVDRYR